MINASLKWAVHAFTYMTVKQSCIAYILIFVLSPNSMMCIYISTNVIHCDSDFTSHDVNTGSFVVLRKRLDYDYLTISDCANWHNYRIKIVIRVELI